MGERDLTGRGRKEWLGSVRRGGGAECGRLRNVGEWGTKKKGGCERWGSVGELSGVIKRGEEEWGGCREGRCGDGGKIMLGRMIAEERGMGNSCEGE